MTDLKETCSAEQRLLLRGLMMDSDSIVPRVSGEPFRFLTQAKHIFFQGALPGRPSLGGTDSRSKKDREP